MVGLVLTAAALDMASVVVNEAVLSLLGLGVQPPDSSIGLMINAAIDVVDQNWNRSSLSGSRVDRAGARLLLSWGRPA